MTSKTPLPEGVEIDVKVYVTSPSTGIDAVVSACGASVIPTELDTVVTLACATINRTVGVTDARPMTRAEIAEYVEQE